MPVTNSPLRYPGGKNSLSAFLAATIKCNAMLGCTYVEPFCGGAGAALNLLFSGNVSRIVINDIDPTIFAFWHSILNDADAFIKLVEATSVTIDEWHRQKQIFQNANVSLLERGFATFFMNRCNRSGILKANPIGGLQQTGEWGIAARYNKPNLIQKIKCIAERKKDIQLFNFDIFDFLDQVIGKLTEKSFIYLDPPYFCQGPALYLNALTKTGHMALAERMIGEKRHIWLATYDNVPDIVQLYSKITVSNFLLNYSAHKTKKGEELLIYPLQTRISQETVHPFYGLLQKTSRASA